MKMAESNKMKEMPVNKLMVQMGIPMILSMALQAVYNIVDSAFVGNMRSGSEAALNALTLVFPVQMLMVAVAIGTGVGTNALLARTLGQGNGKKASKVAGNSLFLGVLIYVICLLFGIFGVKAYISSQTVDPQVVSMGTNYLRICCVISFGIIFFSLFEKLLQATGRSLYSTIGQVVGAVVNIILDPILMVVMGEYAIEGAALATITAQFVQAAVTLNYFLRKSKVVKIHKIQSDAEIKKEMFGVGSSAMMMQLLFMIQHTILYKMAFKYGGDPNGILMSVALRVYAFSFIPLWGMSQGLQPVVGTNFGARQFDRVRQAMKVFSIGGLLLAAIFWIPSLLFSSQILSLFGIEANIIVQGVGNFRLFYSVFILYGIMVMSITFFQSIGNGKKAGVIVMFRQLFLFAPAMILLPMIFGIKAVWFTQPLVDFIMIAIGVVMTITELKNMEKSGPTQNNR